MRDDIAYFKATCSAVTATMRLSPLALMAAVALHGRQMPRGLLPRSLNGAARRRIAGDARGDDCPLISGAGRFHAD